MKIPPNQIDSLIDEVSRIRGRLKSAFAAVNTAAGLSDIESTVLTAVIRAHAAPTVAQIGRSLGHPRQVIQRATNQLIAAGLIAAQDNPDHKRASLLVATPQGLAVLRAASAQAGEISIQLMASLDAGLVAETTAALGRLRQQIEAHFRLEPR